MNRYRTHELTRLYRTNEHLPIALPQDAIVVTIVDAIRGRSYFVETSDGKIIGTAGRARPA